MSGPVLLFSLGGSRFAAAAADVRRVARRGETPFLRASALGVAAEGARGLVVAGAAGEAVLAIDAIHGMVAGRHHPLPTLAAHLLPGGAVAGLIEIDDELLPLVDLPALLGATAEERG